MACSRFLCVIVLGLLPLAHAVPSLPGPGTSARTLLLSSSLSKRQNASTTTPPQCDSTCDPIASLIPTCDAQPSQCCTTLFQSGYANCLVCVGVADNTTAAGFAQAQGLIDNFTITCSQLGFALPKLTLPDQNPNRTLSTVSAGSGHATLSGAQITVSSLPASLGGGGNPTPTISQKTVTSLPGPPESSAAPTSSGGGGAQINSARRIGSRLSAGWVLILIAGLCTALYHTHV